LIVHVPAGGQIFGPAVTLTHQHSSLKCRLLADRNVAGRAQTHTVEAAEGNFGLALVLADDRLLRDEFHGASRGVAPV
jgi:hypothetical protein